MEKSLFFQWLQNTFSPVIQRFVETINGKDGSTPAYLFQQYLSKSFSIDLKWGSLNSNGSSVAADVVALDASVPLKRRDSFGTVEGKVPKLGMKMQKTENEMQELYILEQTNVGGANASIIRDKLFNDPLRSVRGVYERLEYMFLEGLSTGYATISEDINVGTAVRINYGYSPENSFGVGAKWSSDTATPITDIENIQEAARGKGRSVSVMMMDKKAFNNFRSKTQVKELYAAGLNFSGQNIPTPNMAQVNDSLQSNGLPTIVIIDRSVNVEKNGIRTSVRPWAEGVVVFADSVNLGRVVWSNLIESIKPKKDILYTKADDYILVSQWHTNDPYSETVSSQALAVPVIDNVNGIYIMNTEEATTDAQTEGDANFDYDGTSYTRASVIEGINTSENVTADDSMSDVQLQNRINKLSDAEIEGFEAKLVTSA